MTVACPVDIVVNPSNPAQRYILWGNGRIDNVGGAHAVTSQTSTFYNRTDQPVAVAIWVTDWVNGKGYFLDYGGGVQQFGGAPALGTGTAGVDCTAGGIPYNTAARTYVDWSWDPGGSGHFFVVDQWGQIFPFTGTNGPTRNGPRFTHPVVKKIQANWSGGQPTAAVTLDMYGGINTDYTVTYDGSGTSWPGWDAARDIIVTSWGNPIQGYTLDLYGTPHDFGGATRAYGNPYKTGADNARCLANTAASPFTLWQVWCGGQQYEWALKSAPTVIAGGGQSEAQKVTITGAPTGGTFKLVFGGATTGTIAWNATAATVQTTLQALSSVGSGNCTVTGGPGPGTPWTVTFTGALANLNVAQMTSSTLAFTGGTSPGVTIVTTTAGVNGNPLPNTTATSRPTLAWSYSDPNHDAQTQWQIYVYTQSFVGGHSMSDPSVWASSAQAAASGTDQLQRGVVIGNHDFANGTYVLFVRASNDDGLWSAWSSYTWVQNVAPPTPPGTPTATANLSNLTISLSCTATTGGSANLLRFEYSDDGGNTWLVVRGAEALTLNSTTAATDFDPPLGQQRLYRAIAYANNPRVASLYSGVGTGKLNTGAYVLTSTANSALGGTVRPADAPTWTRTSVAGVFLGVGAKYPVVVSDGVPKAQKLSLGLICDSLADYQKVAGLIDSNSTLLYRNPFGEVVYCRIVGDIQRTQVKAAPDAGEGFIVKHAHKVVLPLQEVQPPLLLDLGATTPPGPVGLI